MFYMYWETLGSDRENETCLTCKLKQLTYLKGLPKLKLICSFLCFCCCCLVSLPCVNRFRMCRYFWERLSTFIKKNFWTLCSQYVIYIFVCVDHHLNYSVWHVNVSVNPCFKRSYTVLTQPNQRTKMSETEFWINVVLSPIYFKQEHDEFVWSHVFTL